MKLAEVYNESRFGLSFELFPPKTMAGELALFEHVDVLMQYLPSFITCTYGAGGSTRVKTLEVVHQVKQRFGLPVASHLTCVGSGVEDLREYLQEATELDIDYVVALRGDPPRGEASFRPAPDGFRYANELVSFIRREFSHFDVAVAGYPETHQEAPGPDEDLQNLRRKVDAGADVVITQLFYENDDFRRFRDRCQAAGITVPIVPGLLPVTSLAQIRRITSMCGARLPDSFVGRLGQQDDPQWQFEVGVEYAISQVDDLLHSGVPGMHFYVLNKSQATSRVLDAVPLPIERPCSPDPPDRVV